MRQVSGVVVLLICGVAAGLGMEDSPEKLAAKSDAVVVGTVVGGTYSSSGAVFDLQVDRSLSGELYVGQTLAVSWKSWVRVAGTILIGGDRGLFFLAKEGATWRLVSVSSGHPPFVGTYYPLAKSSSALATSADWITGNTVIEKIASELSASVAQCGSGVLNHLAGEGLIRVEDKSLQRRVKEKLSASDCTEGKALAALLGVKLGESGAWAEVATQIRDIAKTPYIIEASLLVFSFRGNNVDDVRAIGRLATATDSIGPVKDNAVYALSAIHTKETVPFLGQLLSSPDENVRLQAVRGLSMFVDSLPVMTADAAQSMAYLRPPGKGLYRTPETDKFSARRQLPNSEKAADYVKLWKTWWESVKGEFGN
ncbi:MAG: HEAT repeat domain-containing protein [Bryobacteraceae bacterium]